MKVVFLISLTLGLIFIPTVRAQTAYPEVQSLPFFTTVGDYKESTGVQTTVCSGTPITIAGEKRLLPLPSQKTADGKITCSDTLTEACGRPGECVVPRKIVLHTTAGFVNMNELYNFFANGSPSSGGYNGVGSHFAVGKDGQVLQMVEMYPDKTEKAYAVANYGDHISVEINHSGVYSDKNAAPGEQYRAVLGLVKKLMSQYSIPLGNLEYTWKAMSNQPDPTAGSGVFGHYQLNPSNRTDPGIGFFRDLRNDLRTSP